MKRSASETVHFHKVSGAGNHFVLLDVRRGYPAMGKSVLVRALCVKAFSVGADGVIFVEESADADLKVIYCNSDGHEAPMCGNAVRCAARFAFEERIAGARMKIDTACGVREARIRRNSVEVDMGRAQSLRQNVRVSLHSGETTGDVVDTGVPHFVTRVRGHKNLDVEELGRDIRSHESFRPGGVNVNFVSKDADGTFRLRTYERGVEAETLACGTGAVAAAVCLGVRGLVSSPVRFRTKGGESLTIRFDNRADPLSHTRLEGSAHVVYEGDIALSVLKRISRRPRLSR
jgi:diaminopimelate epimerase